MSKTNFLLFLLSLSTLALTFSCVEVKEYQRNFLNDPDMEISEGIIKSYENNFQNYRESATGGNSGKTGGGCGCN